MADLPAKDAPLHIALVALLTELEEAEMQRSSSQYPTRSARCPFDLHSSDATLLPTPPRSSIRSQAGVLSLR